MPRRPELIELFSRLDACRGRPCGGGSVADAAFLIVAPAVGGAAPHLELAGTEESGAHLIAGELRKQHRRRLRDIALAIPDDSIRRLVSPAKHLTRIDPACVRTARAEGAVIRGDTEPHRYGIDAVAATAAEVRARSPAEHAATVLLSAHVNGGRGQHGKDVATRDLHRHAAARKIRIADGTRARLNGRRADAELAGAVVAPAIGPSARGECNATRDLLSGGEEQQMQSAAHERRYQTRCLCPVSKPTECVRAPAVDDRVHLFRRPAGDSLPR